MTSYNQLQAYFDRYYSRFRRVFTDYIINYNSDQYFSWATAILKVPAQNVGYYTSLRAALEAKSPDGYLPASFSPFYLKEVPVTYSINQQMTDAVNRKSVTVSRVGDVVLKTILFSGGEYIDIYVCYDPSKMDFYGAANTLDYMAEQISQVEPFQEQLNTVLIKLRTTHNNAVNALSSGRSTAESTATYRQVIQDTVKELLALKDAPQYLVKISTSCLATEKSDQTPFGSLIDVIGAISFNYYSPSNGLSITPLNTSVMRIGLMDAAVENQVLIDNGDTGGGGFNDVAQKASVVPIPEPEVDPKDYWNNDPYSSNPLPEVIVEAKAKPTAEPETKKNYMPWVLLAIGAYLVLSSDK